MQLQAEVVVAAATETAATEEAVGRRIEVAFANFILFYLE